MENNEPIQENRNGDPFPDAPRGVGGWLAWLIIALTILNPLFSIFLLASEFGTAEHVNPALLQMPPYVQYKWFSWGLILVCCVVSIGAGYRL